MSKRFKGKTCVYCGLESGSTTGDHVFAREFLPIEHRANLPQVPACERCNGDKAKLEHYLLTLLPFGGNHPASTDLLTANVPRRLAKNVKLHRQLAEGRGQVLVKERGILQHSMALPFEGRKLSELFVLITRGMVAHVFGAQIPQDYSVNAGILTERGEGITRPLLAMNAKERAVASLMSLWANGEPTCGAVLENVASTNLFVVPDSLKAALAASSAEPVVSEDDEEADPVGENIAALLTLLDCPFSMIAPYASYVAHEASFDTHQGVKGLEFDRVMVLMDDGDARGFLFGYDKLLGAKAPSASDLKNVAEGKDSSLDRTRRLFYVTCSRAKSSLALVAYSTDPAAMKAHVIQSGLFNEDEVYLGLPT